MGYKTPLGDRIFKELKKHGRMSSLEIAANLDELQDDVAFTLEVLRNEGYLEQDGDVYYIKYVLDPVPRDIPRGFVEYPDILTVSELGGDVGAYDPEYPERYINPHAHDVVWRDQGDRGTCFPGRTRVLMEDFTYKAISKIRVGERVFTHTGEVKPVTEVMKRKWQGRMYKIRVYGVECEIEATPEHPILTKRGWVAIADLTTDDFVAIPTLASHVADKTLVAMESDPDFLWALGVYLAEGSVSDDGEGRTRVAFTLNIEREDIVERLSSVFARYGTEAKARRVPTNKRIDVRINGLGWAAIFEELGGRYCDGKRINRRLMSLSPELQMNICLGWFAGDGHVHTTKPVDVAVSTSRDLINQMQRILLRNGMRGSVYQRKQYQGKLPAWNLDVPTGGKSGGYGRFDGDFYYTKVRTIEKVAQYMGEHVYNIEVADNHSYIVETIAVHNCVGNAAAYGRDLDLMRLAGQTATDIDKGRVQRNVEPIDDLWHDIYYRWSTSAECAYLLSRKIGNVKAPSGSYNICALHALKEYGICLHDQWLASKSNKLYFGENPYPDYSEYLDEKAMETAAKHKIEGFSELFTINDIKRAIFQKGYVIGAIECYENFCSQPNDPQLPDPRGNPCGGHALCFIGYDTDRLYFLHSWWGHKNNPKPEWNKIGWISKTYWQRALLNCYVVHDTEEEKIALARRKPVTFSCNLLGTDVYVDGTRVGATPVDGVLKIGQNYGVRFSNAEYNVTQYYSVDVTDSTSIIRCVFDIGWTAKAFSGFRKLYKNLPRIIELIKRKL